MIVVALAGFPGSGKSTLARGLAVELGAPLLDKDRVREALFGPAHVDYTREQDDFCCAILHQTLAWLAERGAAPRALLDGRTFMQLGQVEQLVAFAAGHGLEVRFVLCTAPPGVLRARLARDAARGTHPARDRNPALLDRLERTAVPLALPHLVLDTHALSPAAALDRAREWILAAPVS